MRVRSGGQPKALWPETPGSQFGYGTYTLVESHIDTALTFADKTPLKNRLGLSILFSTGENMTTKSFTSKVSNGNEATLDKDPRICLPPLTSRLEAMRRSSVRRQVSPASGRALEILGHAVEYLADEYVLKATQTGTLNPADPRIDAMHILMALNREVYYACPEVETALPRIARWLSRSHVWRAPSRRLN
jgi:hypothetical protein